jgi:hypothetical protein
VEPKIISAAHNLCTLSIVLFVCFLFAYLSFIACRTVNNIIINHGVGVSVSISLSLIITPPHVLDIKQHFFWCT